MPKRNLAWILVVAMIALLMWQLPQTIAGRDSVYRAFGPLVDVRAQIHRRFVEDVDDQKLVDSAVQAAIDAMVKQLHDPHAIYLDPNAYDRFKKRTDGVFGGIGVDVWAVEQGLEVLSREPNSPAARAGILPGDIITHVDGQATNKVSLVDAVNNLLNGPAGTEVVLAIIRPGQAPPQDSIQLTVRRAEIDVDPIRGWSREPTGGWRFMLDPQYGIAYVRLTKFTQDVDKRLDERMKRLLGENMRGLVLDLRENTGGLLNSAIEVADRFLESGLIVSTRGRKTDEKRWFATHDIGYPNFPMIVLVNHTTASAAEIVAGALRDHKRAAVVGERSYGKGSVQEVVELDRQTGALKLTTAYYYLPGGECIQRTAKSVQEGSWGVVPTIPVNLSESQRHRWLETWREAGREVVAAPSSQPTTLPETAEEVEGRSAAALIEADLQLANAIEHVRQEIRGPVTTKATSRK